MNKDKINIELDVSFPVEKLNEIVPDFQNNLVNKKEIFYIKSGEDIIAQILPYDELNVDKAIADKVRLEIGYNLIDLVQSGELVPRIRSMRHNLAGSYGFITPLICIIDNMELSGNQYSIYIYDKEVFSAEVDTEKLFCLNTDDTDIEGEITKEPNYNLEGRLLDNDNAAKAEKKGYTILKPSQIISTSLNRCLLENVTDIYTGMELKKLVNGAKIKFKDEVNIFSKTNNWQLLGSVIHSLIKEEYSARCIGLILQEINNNSNLEAKGIVELIKKRIENIKTLRIAKPSY